MIEIHRAFLVCLVILWTWHATEGRLDCPNLTIHFAVCCTGLHWLGLHVLRLFVGSGCQAGFFCLSPIWQNQLMGPNPFSPCTSESSPINSWLTLVYVGYTFGIYVVSYSCRAYCMLKGQVYGLHGQISRESGVLMTHIIFPEQICFDSTCDVFSCNDSKKREG